MLRIYLSNLKKKWLGSLLGPVCITVFIPIIANIWPEFKNQSEAMMAILNNPVYKALLGEIGLFNIGTWQGLFFIYIFVWLEWVMIFASVMIPTGLITSEVVKRTLDVSLSYPIPRWRYLLEKFAVYQTNNLWYPLLIIPITYFVTSSLGEQMDYYLLTQTAFGAWLMFFALGSISLLCAAIFLEPGRSLGAAGVVIFGQYLLIKVASLVDSLSYLKAWSIFNYMKADTVLQEGGIPLINYLIIIIVGLSALSMALYIFQNREIAY
ncbi:ABC transporter permease subunit [Candidatus Bathyarchaeota archaeon]|nr:ABC transporter permease subunit [Candidatus Bathyarchaeota archaeon]